MGGCYTKGLDYGQKYYFNEVNEAIETGPVSSLPSSQNVSLYLKLKHYNLHNNIVVQSPLDYGTISILESWVLVFLEQSIVPLLLQNLVIRTRNLQFFEHVLLAHLQV